jgi:hypothetical protein
MANPRRNRILVGAALLWWVIAVGCAGTGADREAPPPSGPDGRSPGLSVVYLQTFVRHIDALPGEKAFRRHGYRGAPIGRFDHAFDGVPVFGSGLSRGVAMDATGQILLDRKGTYRFRAVSNDGIRVFLDGRMLFEDPDVHSARLSPEGVFEVGDPGWHDIQIRYFQRKGTAALSLRWLPPGSNAYEVVPADALSHTGP